MIKTQEKIQARHLRSEGYSVKGIAKKLNVSPSSVSLWVRDLPQPEEFSKETRNRKKMEREEYLNQIRKQREEEKYPSDDKIALHVLSIQTTGMPILSRRLLSGDGRWMIPAPTYYEGKKYIGERYVYEHRLIFEEYLGRLLEFDEVIHHLNGNKLDNRIENLFLMSRSEHSSEHSKEPILIDLNCDFCCLSHAVIFQHRNKT
jgi:transposase-like protein